VVGHKFQKRWETLCESSWRSYASRHGYDLIPIATELDGSRRARGRSPAWQKCLVLSQGFSTRYDQIVWVDADIAIRPDAPSIADGVPVDAVGAVNECTSPTPEQFHLANLAEQCLWRAAGVPFVPGETAREFYATYGLPTTFEEVVQTGVLVLSPRHHRDLLERVYIGYEDRGSAAWNYEMRPLSFEILKTGSVHWLDPRFNVPWGLVKLLDSPDLARVGRASALLLHPRHPLRPRLAQCAHRALEAAFFLHFAGCAHEMVLLRPPSAVAP
jgi:hypothetical protein